MPLRLCHPVWTLLLQHQICHLLTLWWLILLSQLLVDAQVDAANVPNSHVEAIPVGATVIEDSPSGTEEPLECSAAMSAADASSAPVQDGVSDEVEVMDSLSVSLDLGILSSVSSEVLDCSAELSTASSILELTCKLMGNWVPFCDSRYPNVQSVRHSLQTS